MTDPERVAILLDPPPPGAGPGQWWPPQMLDAEWIRTHEADFDVLHLHFGAESYSLAHVLAAVEAARRADKPFVYTVHDLENPQLSEQTEHLRMLDEIVPAADVLVTLTPGARDEIAARWGRTALVIPHPTLLEAGAAPLGDPHPGLRVGVHLRDLRPNIDAAGVVTTLIESVAELRAAGSNVTAVVRLNERVRDEELSRMLAGLVADSEGVELLRSPRLSDAELARSIADLDACLLPYSHGTHSGWLELCHDLAVPVIGPRRGHFGDQHPGDYFRFDVGDPASLTSAITRATIPPESTTRSRPGSSARAAEVAERAVSRAAQRDAVRSAHVQLYRSLSTERHAA